ncbi:hypothetical protein Q75_07895 [Bacillus coahuilensis p1.1.43]|uniref:Uncharacterized protein n=1 Tax=Bacillus coahuilensis p1.1.43 TaxID=1150625 RepID=A0A147K8H0_9BACI|nr:hypothetical protein [Bacillus coahuilensis]KUP06448.1 hypothetical protein Q75_07895 [Bacillus coahuilensis p1.1.43]
MKRKIYKIGIPTFLVLLFLGLLYFQQLQSNLTLPSENWSRSISLQTEIDKKEQILIEDNNIFTPSSNGIIHTTLDSELKVVSQEKIPVTFPLGATYWTNGTYTYFIQDKNLMVYTEEKTSIVFEDVTQFVELQEYIFFISANELYKSPLSSNEIESVSTFDFELIQLSTIEDQALVVLDNVDNQGQKSNMYVYTPTNNKLTLMTTMSNNSQERIKDVNGIIVEEQYQLLVEVEARSQGAISNRVHTLNFLLEDLPTKISPSPLVFKEKNRDVTLYSPRELQTRESNGKLEVLYVAEDIQIENEFTQSVYIGTVENNSVNSSLVSKTRNSSNGPVFIPSLNAITWYDVKGTVTNVYASSSHEDIKIESQNPTNEDYKQALYQSIIMAFSSLVALITASYWFFPSLALLILLYMFKSQWIEGSYERIVEYIAIAIFLILPAFYYTKGKTDYFLEMAPDYLTFSGSSLIIHLLLTLLTFVIYKLNRDEDWGVFAGTFYFMGMYVLLFLVTIGPYLFNLY